MGKVHNALEFIDNKYSYIQSTCNEKRKIHDSRRKFLIKYNFLISRKQKLMTYIYHRMGKRFHIVGTGITHLIRGYLILNIYQNLFLYQR